MTCPKAPRRNNGIHADTPGHCRTCHHHHCRHCKKCIRCGCVANWKAEPVKAAVVRGEPGRPSIVSVVLRGES